MTPSNYVPEEILPFYKKAGKAAAKGLQHGATLVKEGAKPVDVLDAIEEKIKSEGAGIGFPAQLSINECAAHACADDNDETILKEGDVVKLDCGAHVNGCIGDNALTIDLSTNGQWTELLKASKEARDTVIKTLHPGITPNEIGTTAQEVIESYGYQPVRNLCGHGLAPYVIHTSPSVPSYPNNVHTFQPDKKNKTKKSNRTRSAQAHRTIRRASFHDAMVDKSIRRRKNSLWTQRAFSHGHHQQVRTAS